MANQETRVKELWHAIVLWWSGDDVIDTLIRPPRPIYREPIWARVRLEKKL
jgi:hypothetical protein